MNLQTAAAAAAACCCCVCRGLNSSMLKTRHKQKKQARLCVPFSLAHLFLEHEHSYMRRIVVVYTAADCSRLEMSFEQSEYWFCIVDAKSSQIQERVNPTVAVGSIRQQSQSNMTVHTLKIQKRTNERKNEGN